MLDADHQLSGNLRYLQTLQTLDKNINSVTMEWREKKYSLRTKRLLRNNQTLL